MVMLHRLSRSLSSIRPRRLDDTPRPWLIEDEHPAFPTRKERVRNAYLSYGISFLATAFTIGYMYYHKVHGESIVEDELKQLEKSVGLYLWGSNASHLIDPHSSPTNKFREPKALQFFNGKKLRDVHFGTTHAAAIDEHGHLIQWGSGFDSQNPSPCPTVTGKNLVQVQCTDDRVFALAGNGDVYCLDASKKKQEDISGNRPSSFWSWFSTPVYNARYQLSLSGDGIKKVSCGRDHLVLLSKKGKVYSLETQNEPEQLVPVSVATLGIPVDDISTGDQHTLMKTRDGRVFGFGANVYGELGPGNSGTPIPMVNDPVEIQTLWSRHYKSTRPDNMKCTMIQAGGKTSFFVVEKQGQEQDVLSCGFGQNGQLGTGMYTQLQLHPARLKTISDFQEYNEELNKVVPIRIDSIYPGKNHFAATIRTGKDTRDVYMWGDNSSGEIIRSDGKRGLVSAPVWARNIWNDSAQGLQLKESAKDKDEIVCGPQLTAIFMKPQ